MQDETFFDSIKRNLNGEPGQPIVLGVCKTLAARFGQEVWLIRLAAIVLGVFYSFITLAVYIMLGLFMKKHQTVPRACLKAWASGSGSLRKKWAGNLAIHSVTKTLPTGITGDWRVTLILPMSLVAIGGYAVTRPAGL